MSGPDRDEYFRAKNERRNSILIGCVHLGIRFGESKLFGGIREEILERRLLDLRDLFPLEDDVAVVLHPGSRGDESTDEDRKSTRLNSSHLVISYAVFCL